MDFPEDTSMRISHEAIYQALYVQGRGALRRELTACLRTGRALRVTPNDVHPISSDQYPTAARRPSNSRLDTTLFRSTFGLELPHWQEGLGHVLQQILRTP